MHPYVQVQANLISTLFLQNFWVNILTLDLDQFKTNIYISLIVNEDLQVCPGMGWETQRILLRFLYNMKFWNCSKTLIEDLKDYRRTWTGFDA